MNVEIRTVDESADEKVIICCAEVTREVEEIRSFALSKGSEISGMQDGRAFCIPLKSVCYFEAVDEKSFACTDERVYEIKGRLYELEERFSENGFVRCSKSVLISVFAIESISPAMNGRFFAHLRNGEKVVISRRYVGDIKSAVLGQCAEATEKGAIKQ